MKRLMMLFTALMLLVGVPALAQDTETESQADFFTGFLATEETLVYRLPVGTDYLVTITGERLMSRTFLKFNITTTSGVPVAADTPVRVNMSFDAWRDSSGARPVTTTLTNQNGLYTSEVMTFPSEGELRGTLNIGGVPTEFGIQVFPNRPPLPGWFAPLNLAIPFIVLAVILGIVLTRKVTLFRLPGATAGA
jgi:hypothetical protein